MSISRSTFLARACVVVVIWVASIPIAEATFRLLGDEPSTALRGLYTPFENGNFKNAAAVDTDAFLASGRLSVHTDDLGLRCDRDRRFAINRGEAVDILLLGDSQGFGNGLNFEDTIAGVCAKRASNRGIRVANASVGGHSLASQLALAKWLVGRQGVKVKTFVVLLTPAMINGGDSLNRAVVGSDGRLYGDTVGASAMLALWAKTHLVTYSRVRDAVRNSGIGADPAKDSPLVFGFYERHAQLPSVVASIFKAARKVQEFADTHGATVEIVYVPLTVEADFESLKRLAAATGRELDAGVPLGIAMTVGQRLGVPVHTLNPALERIHRAGQPLVVTGDFHYSAALSQECGERLAMEILH